MRFKFSCETDLKTWVSVPIIILWQTNKQTTAWSPDCANVRSLFFCLFVWFLNVLVNYYVISRTGPKTECLTILRAATHEKELGDHDFCLSRSHYTDTDPTSRERTPGGHSGNRTRDLLTRSRALYRLNYRAPVRSLCPTRKPFFAMFRLGQEL